MIILTGDFNTVYFCVEHKQYDYNKEQIKFTMIALVDFHWYYILLKILPPTGKKYT